MGYWEEAEPVRGGAWWEEVRSLGVWPEGEIDGVIA
jgi:hypothetical protein